jgi:hypothetical protein
VGAPVAPSVQPTVIEPGVGWAGLDYQSACVWCVPPDPQVAVGMGYLVEVTNGAERVWFTNGTLLLNQSLDSLFWAGQDPIAFPQVVLDPTSLRWFVSAVDLQNHQVLFGVSSSSDPTSPFFLQHLNPPPATRPGDDLLAVTPTSLLLSVSEYSPSNSLLGAQLWATNKSALLLNHPGPLVAVDNPDPSTASLVPATPLSPSPTLYLLDNGLGAGSTLHLFAFTGSPPGPVSLVPLANFSTSATPPPNAVQPSTSNLLDVGSGSLQNAVWRANSLWAVATQGCTPPGDSALRSCLHLWQIDTASLALTQDFLWSSGPHTYDFDPALSLATRGDLALVFGESSASLFPSFYASGQAVSDPAKTLEVPRALHNGTGPIDPWFGCPNDVCNFGDDFAIAFDPASSSHFWAVGEFENRTYSSDVWRTWVNQVSALAASPVTFTESGLPAGTAWSLTINGVVSSTTGPSMDLLEPNGSYTYTVESPISGGSGSQYVASPASGTFAVAGAPVKLSLAFQLQYEVSLSAHPGTAGNVFPSGGWFAASATVSLSALANPGYTFAAWSGSGTGSYSGTDDPANITVGGPIHEVAEFWVVVDYPVSLVASGLPSGTTWSATVNGVPETSSSATIEIDEPNGTYQYNLSTPIAGPPGTEYVTNRSTGTFDVRGSSVSVPVTYSTEFALNASPATAGTGVITPANGWYPSGASLTLSALAASGEVFVGWTGTGLGSYTGPSNPAQVTLDGPVTEVARFAATTTYPLTFTETGLPAGTAWTVVANGVPSSTTTGSVLLYEPNGSYTFSVTTTYKGPNGTALLASPASGTVIVAGAPVQVAVAFGPPGATPAPPVVRKAATSVEAVPVWAFVAAMIVAILGVAIAFVSFSRRKTPPRQRVDPPSAEPPPPTS